MNTAFRLRTATLRLAPVLALCGAANLAHAADIPGVLGDPGIATEATRNAQPIATIPGVLGDPGIATNEPQQFPGVRKVIDNSKHWFAGVAVNHDPDAKAKTACYAFTPIYDSKTQKIETTPPPSHFDEEFDTRALWIQYYKEYPRIVHVGVELSNNLLVGETSILKFGSTGPAFNLVHKGEFDTADGPRAFYAKHDTSKPVPYILIDRILRGRDAYLYTPSPNGLLINQFSLMGATAMHNAAARACNVESVANRSALKPRPQRTQTTTGQPSQQARTTNRQRHHQTQTTTHQTRENTFVEDVADQVVDQATQTIVDVVVDEWLGDFGF